MTLKDTTFTIRTIGENPHEKLSDAWRAGHIVEAMEGCSIGSIIEALTMFEDNRHSGIGDPARWIAAFAGLDSKIDPWIEILLGGQLITSKEAYYKQIALQPPRYIVEGEIHHI